MGSNEINMRIAAMVSPVGIINELHYTRSLFFIALPLLHKDTRSNFTLCRSKRVSVNSLRLVQGEFPPVSVEFTEFPSSR